MTLARAIEVRRPLLRSTNTGITTGILANGDLLPESLLHQEWVGQLEVKYKKQAPLSFYATYGDIDFWFYLFLFLLILGINKVVYDRTRRT